MKPIAHRQSSGPCVDLLAEACFGIPRPTHKELAPARYALLNGVDAASVAGAESGDVVLRYYYMAWGDK